MTTILVDELTAPKPKLMGLVEPRVHTPYLEGKTISKQVEKLAEQIGMPLMPWQKFVLADMMKVDKKGIALIHIPNIPSITTRQPAIENRLALLSVAVSNL